MKVAFLDRDGTLIREPEDTRQVDSLEKLDILPGVMEGLRTLRDDGFILVLVSNQDGMGTSSFPTESFELPQAEFVRLLRQQDIVFEEIFVCPHLPGDGCDCRKPRTALVQKFLRENPVDLIESLMIGDRETDREFAGNIGVRYVSMETNGSFPIRERL